MSTLPSSRSTPQWPWSVYSSRQQSAMSTQLSPRRWRSEPSVVWITPEGFHASEPMGSSRAGTREEHRADSRADRLLRQVARALHGLLAMSGQGGELDRGGDPFTDKQRMDEVGRGKPGTRPRLRSAAVRRSRRGRSSGKGMAAPG